MPLLVALVLLAPGRLAATLERDPQPGDRVSLCEFDRRGKPRPFLVAVDRETFAAVGGHKLGPLLEAWEAGEAWYVEGPIRAVLLEPAVPVADEAPDHGDAPASRPAVLVRLIGGPYDDVTVAVAEAAIVRP